jgi:hypothetical protein
MEPDRFLLTSNLCKLLDDPDNFEAPCVPIVVKRIVFIFIYWIDFETHRIYNSLYINMNNKWVLMNKKIPLNSSAPHKCKKISSMA